VQASSAEIRSCHSFGGAGKSVDHSGEARQRIAQRLADRSAAADSPAADFMAWPRMLIPGAGGPLWRRGEPGDRDEATDQQQHQDQRDAHEGQDADVFSARLGIGAAATESDEAPQDGTNGTRQNCHGSEYRASAGK